MAIRNNIKQITEIFCQKNLTPVDNYYNLSADIFAPKLKDAKIIKLGYVCEPKGIENGRPIYLTIDNIERKFEIKKPGIFEIQEEIFVDVNNLNDKKKIQLLVTNVRVPADIKFTLDYIVAFDDESYNNEKGEDIHEN